MAYHKYHRGVGEDGKALRDIGHVRAVEAASFYGGMVTSAHLWRDLHRI